MLQARLLQGGATLTTVERYIGAQRKLLTCTVFDEVKQGAFLSHTRKVEIVNSGYFSPDRRSE